MSTLAEDLARVMPGQDPLTGDFLQIITRDQYFEIMGPMHETKFWRIASRHADNTAGPLVLDIPHFVDSWWPVNADMTATIRWSPDGEFISMAAIRRVNPTTVHYAMHIGEAPTSNFMRGILWDIGIRRLTHEARASRVVLTEAREWTKITPNPNSHGRYDYEYRMTRRPELKNLEHPPGANPGRR